MEGRDDIIKEWMAVQPAGPEMSCLGGPNYVVDPMPDRHNRTDQFAERPLRPYINPPLSPFPRLPPRPASPSSPGMCYVYGSVQVATSVCPMCKFFKPSGARYPPTACLSSFRRPLISPSGALTSTMYARIARFTHATK